MLLLFYILQVLQAACPIKELRAQLLSDEVLGKLGILSLAQFGQTDREYYQLTRQFVIANVERVYDIYWSTPGEDTLERDALKRRVRCLLPSPRDSKHQRAFNRYTSALFSSKPVEGDMVATNRFPELCRMIFKHHTFGGANHSWQHGIIGNISVLKKQWIELTLPKDNQVASSAFCAAATFADKATAVKLASKLEKPTCFTSRILDGASFADMVDNVAQLSVDDLHLVAMLATGENLVPAKAIFSRLVRHAEFNTYLLPLIRHGHPELVEFILEQVSLTELERRKYVLIIVNLGRPTALYRGLRGKALYGQCREFLDSYRSSRGRFMRRKPVRLSFRMLLEAALVLGYSDEVVVHIIKRKWSRTDEHLLVLAMAVEAPKHVLYSLLERFNPKRSSLNVIGREFVLANYSKMVEIPMDYFVFESFARSKRDGALNAKMLLSLASKATIGFAPIKQLLLRLDENSCESLLSAAMADLWRVPDRMVEMRALLQFAVANALPFSLCSGPYAQSVLFGPFDYFIDYTVEELLERLPRRLTDSIIRFGFSHNLFVLVVKTILARPHGFEALQAHLDCSGELQVLMYFLKDKRLSMKALALQLSGTPGSNVWPQVCQMLVTHQDLKTRLFDEIVRNFDSPSMINLVGHFIVASLLARADVEEVPMLCSLSTEQLDMLFGAQPGILARLALSPTSAQWLGEHNLITRALKALVFIFNIRSPAALSQKCPAILPFLPTQDAAELDTMIVELLQQQDEIDGDLSFI